MSELTTNTTTIKPATAAEALAATLRGLNYCSTIIGEVLDFYYTHDSVYGGAAVDTEDRASLERLIRSFDSEPDQWPSSADDGRWITHDSVDSAAKAWAALDAADRDPEPFPFPVAAPLSGGAPAGPDVELVRLGLLSCRLADQIARDRAGHDV